MTGNKGPKCPKIEAKKSKRDMIKKLGDKISLIPRLYIHITVLFIYSTLLNPYVRMDVFFILRHDPSLFFH